MEILNNQKPSSDDGGFVTGIFCIGLLLTVLGLVSGLAGFVYQLYFWLKNGIWKAIPLAFFLKKANMNLDSIYHPTDWTGLAKVFQWLIELQAGLSLLIPGFALFLLSMVLSSVFEN